mmetsp:Transcript_73508/g.149240  ORF Transcript_73508/g.149240 Transcript_73508/m.149240 type:complete len:175 (+) Transcript_73508:543-1067(+)
MFFLVHIDVQRFPLKLNQLLQLLACLTKYLLLLSAAIALSVSSTAFPGFVEFFLYRPYRNDDDERLRLVTAVSPPSKHRLQQSGNRHSISGSSPPQSENNTFNFALLRKSHMDSGMLPLRKLNCTRNSDRLWNCPFVISGTVPVKSLPSKNRSRIKVALEKLCGIVPEKVLLDR